jgi:hypothetical protein
VNLLKNSIMNFHQQQPAGYESENERLDDEQEEEKFFDAKSCPQKEQPSRARESEVVGIAQDEQLPQQQQMAEEVVQPPPVFQQNLIVEQPEKLVFNSNQANANQLLDVHAIEERIRLLELEAQKQLEQNMQDSSLLKQSSLKEQQPLQQLEIYN